MSEYPTSKASFEHGEYPSGIKKNVWLLPTSLQPAGNPLIFRCLTIFAITLLLLLPLSYFTGLVEERSDLHDEAVANITSRWGQSQTVCGPALVIPYVTRGAYQTQDYDEGARGERSGGGYGTRHLVILPHSISFSTKLAPEKRYKGIYHYVVYTAPVTVQGEYRLPEDGPLKDSRNLFFWDQAFLSLGVTDLKAITGMGSLAWDGREGAPFEPGVQTMGMLGPSFHSRVSLRADQRDYAFSLDMTLNGSGGIYFTPVGETSNINISGNWPDPNFDGQILANTREITPDGFKAEWTVPHLGRAYPQSGDLDMYAAMSADSRGIDDFTAGVSLIESVPLYRQITRAVKYGLLFIGLTFTALLGFEIICRRQLHLLQYGLVGVAMCLFYLVLLSVAEHAAFWKAFSLASAVCVLMNGLYIAAALRSKAKGLLIALLLICLYGVLYALLQMEGYSVLVGTVLVVFVVCLLMYLTRNLRSFGDDGHEEGREDPSEEPAPEAQENGYGQEAETALSEPASEQGDVVPVEEAAGRQDED